VEWNIPNTQFSFEAVPPYLLSSGENLPACIGPKLAGTLARLHTIHVSIDMREIFYNDYYFDQNTRRYENLLPYALPIFQY